MPGARWASRRDLDGSERAQRWQGEPALAGRLALGRHRGRLLRAEQRHALVAFGPPQSGKSAGLGDPGAARMAGAGGCLVDQDRPARRDARRGGGSSARRSCSTRSSCPARPVTPGRRCAAPRPGTARSRSRGGWRRPASSTSAASRAATSGRSRPSSGWRRCCTRRRAAGGGIEQVVAWAYGQGATSARRRARPRARERGHGSGTGSMRARHTRRCGRSSRRPTGRAARSRRRRRRCCGPTGSHALRARRGAARSRPSGCSIQTRRST